MDQMLPYDVRVRLPSFGADVLASDGEGRSLSPFIVAPTVMRRCEDLVGRFGILFVCGREEW